MVKNEIKAYKTRGYFEEYTSFDDSYDNNSLCDTNSQFDWENHSTNASSTSLYSNEWGEEESEIDETELYENVRIAAANLRAVISDEKEQHQRQPSTTINSDEVFYDCITYGAAIEYAQLPQKQSTFGSENKSTKTTLDKGVTK
jgi:hypothetical protein